MLSTFLVDAQAKRLIAERLEERKFDRDIRVENAKKIAQRNLRREITRLLKADGNIQSVLDVLEQLAPEQSALRMDRNTRTTCGA
jgi:hypothetical protein